MKITLSLLAAITLGNVCGAPAPEPQLSSHYQRVIFDTNSTYWFCIDPAWEVINTKFFFADLHGCIYTPLATRVALDENANPFVAKPLSLLSTIGLDRSIASF